MRLVCPKQRKHGIAITNEKMYYDTDNQKLFLDSDENAKDDRREIAFDQKNAKTHGVGIIMDDGELKGVCFPNLVRKNFSIAIYKTPTDKNHEILHTAIYALKWN